MNLFKALMVATCVVLVSCAESTSSPPQTSDETIVDAVPAAESEVSPQLVAPEFKWEYRDETDEMRGTKNTFASIESENEVGVNWPYTPGPAKLLLRQRSTDGLAVLVLIEGQFTCSLSRSNRIAVKFDDSEIEYFGCSEPQSGGSGAIFIEPETKFIESLKIAKRVVVELPVYEAGAQQMIFMVEGLKWED